MVFLRNKQQAKWKLQHPGSQGKLSRWAVESIEPRRPSKQWELDDGSRQLGSRREANAALELRSLHNDLLRGTQIKSSTPLYWYRDFPLYCWTLHSPRRPGDLPGYYNHWRCYRLVPLLRRAKPQTLPSLQDVRSPKTHVSYQICSH